MPKASTHQARQAPIKINQSLTLASSAVKGAQSISVSKHKAALRSALRLLAKNGLDAGLRVETERKVEALKTELAEVERSKLSFAGKNGEDVPVKAKEPRKKLEDEIMAKNQKRKKRTGTNVNGQNNEKRQAIYKMLRHVEYQKTARRMKHANKQLMSVKEQLQTLEDQEVKLTKDSKQKYKALKRQAEVNEEEALRAVADAWYVAVSRIRPQDDSSLVIF